MWLYFMIAFVEYVIVSMVISVDAYESKSRKRCKRLGKMNYGWYYILFIKNSA